MKINQKFLILMIVFTIILYSIFIMISDAGKLYSSISQFKIQYLPLILGLISLGWLLFFERWNLLLKNVGINIPVQSNLGIYFSGFAVGFTPGRIGELFKSQMLKDKHDISRTKTAPLVIIERLYDMLGAIAVAAIGVIFLPVVWYVIVISVVIVVMIFIAFSSRVLFDKFLKITSKIKFLSGLAEPLSKSYETVRSSIRGRIAIISSLLSMGNWLVTSLAVYFIVVSYGIDNLDYIHIIPAFTASSILGAVSFIPGGIGITEGSFAGFLTLLHLNISSVLVLTILVRIFTLWYGVLVGFIALKLSKGISLGAQTS